MTTTNTATITSRCKRCGGLLAGLHVHRRHQPQNTNEENNE